MKYFFSIIFFHILYFVCPCQLLVMPGDHPDPSVTKIGDTYWASATTSNWFPAFPLMQSQDLVHWKTSGHVFNKLPDWADYYFWAPEISYEKGKVYVYYAAHKKKGNLCIGVASADKPEGPYTDHGPLMCQEDGSIDAFPMRDENGKLYLIWKEDGNSVGKSTPIWASEMNEERTALIGEKKQLFKNTEAWEANLVEGVSMMRHGEYFYAFYAAAGCCGKGCTYTSGIARSKKLLGPWEKYSKNPVITNNYKWICPGHGTPIEKDGKFYFLYHAYDKEMNVYTGRQGLLREFEFTDDAWVVFPEPQVNESVAVPALMRDEFVQANLSDNWEWSVFQNINYFVSKGRLYLSALPGASGAFVAQKTLMGDYKSTALIVPALSNAGAGIAAIGNDYNLVSATYRNGRIKITHVKEGKQTDLLEKAVVVKNQIYIRLIVRNGKDIQFSYSIDGKNFIMLNDKSIDGSYLPPWDRAIRVGLVATGTPEEKAVFESFSMDGKDEKTGSL